MSTVTADSTRINDSNTNGGWGNYNVGGGAPGAEGQNAYQGGLAVNRKVNTTSDREGVKYSGAGTDTTQAANKLVLLKGTVADYSDLNTTFGLELAAGSAEGQHYEYNCAGSGANNDWFTVGYNAVGGVAGAYVFVAIDPSIAEWREVTVGSPNLASVAFFAIGAQFQVGQAKSENVALDAIDIGTGLTYAGTAFSFQDGVDEDQGITANRWGWAAAVGSAIFLRGLHVVNATGTDTSIVFFPDGYHSTGTFGVEAQATTEFAGSYTGLGRAYSTTDTRPVWTSTGSPTMSGSFANWHTATLNATTTVTGSVEFEQITQSGATFDGAEIKTNSLAGQATFTDPDLTKFTDTRVNQAGAGHAFEITVAGTYNIDELRLNNFGADGTTSAAFHNSSGGLVTLERLDAATPTPTVRNTNGSTTAIPSVQSGFTVQGVPVGAEIRIYDNEDLDGNQLGTELDGIESHVGGDFVYTHSNPNNLILVQVIHTGFLEENQPANTGVGNNSINITLTPEGNL